MPVTLHAGSLSWADLVFHVLAHLRATAHLPPSNYDPVYVAFVRQHVGPAQERALGQDIGVLERVVDTHESLARLQLLAWLFITTERAMASASEELALVHPSSVDDSQLLAPLLRAGPAVEVLRCAALLEIDTWATLPKGQPNAVVLQEALNQVALVAPQLWKCDVGVVRSLRLRGRVRGRHIWVGVPSARLRVSCAHVAWQAAHEATVCEVSEAMVATNRPPTFWSQEAVALVLLAERSSDAGLSVEHASWLAHLNHPPSTHRSALDPDELAVLERCVRDGS